MTLREALVKSVTMAKVTKIHQGKQTVRRHYIGEWLELKNMAVSDLVAALNDPDRDSSLPEIDKTQVYRWLKGQMPGAATQARLAAIFGFEGEPERLLQDPSIDWISHFFKDKTEEQKQKAIDMLKILFSDSRTGTDG